MPELADGPRQLAGSMAFGTPGLGQRRRAAGRQSLNGRRESFTYARRDTALVSVLRARESVRSDESGPVRLTISDESGLISPKISGYYSVTKTPKGK